ncbi:hypothetical protein GGI19_004501 [Coemansia pectinata]|uniref:Uncharacterized protein n=1 Tax=Coemansia pectinata TaxID=1052879 RepID=A0A9W8GTW6_9FUNG|nr:hypothetical protein GGI19_004501 [Coemansia pectinata]
MRETLERQQRRQAMVERREQVPELALSRSSISVPTSSPYRVLQLVLDYLSPVPGPSCTSNGLLAHLRSLQRVAAVNREWRAVALPMFYRTAYVIIGYPLDSLDAYDSDGKGMLSDGSDNSASEGDIHAVDTDGQGEVKRGDDWDSGDDEELLNTIGLSRDGVEICLDTNIGLIHAMGQTGNVREVQIIVQGMGQTAGQLLHQLLLAELGRHMWPAVERLRIDMRDSSSTTRTYTMAEEKPKAVEELNNLLSDILPSLREIKFYGPHSKAIYGCVLVERLFKERLHRPESLRAVRVKSDCWPKLADDCDVRKTDLPVYIECMEIDGPDETYIMPIPTMVADTLVDLKLNPLIVGYEWKLFEYLGDLCSTKKGSGSSKPPLSFSSLKSLALNFMYIKVDFEARTEEITNYRRHSGYNSKHLYRDWDAHFCDRSFDSDSSGSGDSEEEEDSDEDCHYYLSNLHGQVSKRFANVPDYDTPEFPMLTSLELPDSIFFARMRMFAAGPISSLVLRCLPRSFDASLNLSILSSLRNLSVQFSSSMDNYDATVINKVLSTACPGLQHLALAVIIDKDSQLSFPAPPFADSLRSLTLEGEYGQRDVEHMLRLFPNLRKLDVCVIVGDPILSVSELADEYCRLDTTQSLTPLNSSLGFLSAYDERYFTGFGGTNCTVESKRVMAPELNHYRGMLIGLVCRLPALAGLRVCAQSADGVNESIGAIADTGVGQEHISHLQRLIVRPLDY